MDVDNIAEGTATTVVVKFKTKFGQVVLFVCDPSCCVYPCCKITANAQVGKSVMAAAKD